MLSRTTIHRDTPVPLLHIRLLGGFHLQLGDATITTFEIPRLQSLLTYLLLHRNTPHSRSQLAFLFWPDSTEAQAHANLRNLIYRLRQALPHANALLHIERHTLQWRTEAPWTLDVRDFEQSLTTAEQAALAGRPLEQRQALEKAAMLYRGDLLPDCYSEWLLPERDRLHQAFFKGQLRLIELLEQIHDYSAAIAATQLILRHEPLHEEAYRRLMRLYTACGDRADALRIYHNCVSTLERELDIKPDRLTQQLYEQILEDATPPFLQPAHPLPYGAPLIGRTPEWSTLLTCWQQAARGRAQAVMLTGEAGIGKSRMAEELALWASRSGGTSATSRCYQAESDLAYAPLINWLKQKAFENSLAALPRFWQAEVARLLPELLLQQPDLHRPDPMYEGWQRQHLLEALALAILGACQRGGSPLLLILDDLQWAGAETLAFLHYLLRYAPDAPLLLTGTIRTEEVRADHLLISWLAHLQQEGILTEIELGPLDAPATVSLAEALLGNALDPLSQARIYQETEGHPLFIVETVRIHTLQPSALQPQYSLLAPPSSSTLPATIQSVLALRLAQLSTPARELAALAAVIGRAFTFSVLIQASGKEEDTIVQALDELWQRRIVRERGSEAYDFSHDKLRVTAYASLSGARRRMLHQRVARALENLHVQQLDSVSEQIANHYELAAIPEKAITYYEHAGNLAMQIYANAEALSLFQRAIALLETSSLAGQHISLARLYERCADVLDLTGQFERSWQMFQMALTHLPAQEQIWRARLHRRTGRTWNQRWQFHEALGAYKEAENALGPTGGEHRSEWWQEWLYNQIDSLYPLYALARVEEMTTILEQIEPLMTQPYVTEIQRAYFFQYLFLRDCRRYRCRLTEEALVYCQISLAANQESKVLHEIGNSHYNLALCLAWSGRLTEAEEQIQIALQMAQSSDDMTLQLMCLEASSVIFIRLRKIEKVRAASERVLTLGLAGYIAMAHASQAWMSWHDGNYDIAEEQGCTALQKWEQLSFVYPCKWVALFPLLAIALSSKRLADAIEYAQLLLDPTQELLPHPVILALEAGVRAWTSRQSELADSASFQLQQALLFAQEMNYL